MRNVQVSLDSLEVDRTDLEHALAKVRPSALRETLVTVADVKWSDIGGVGEARDRLKEVVERPLLHPEVLVAMKMRPPIGVLLYGPPRDGEDPPRQSSGPRMSGQLCAGEGAGDLQQVVGGI